MRSKRKAWACSHTDKPNVAWGLCDACYRKKHYRKRRGKKLVSKENKLKKKYGMSYASLEALFERQDGKCGVCKRPLELTTPVTTPDRACVDHNHETNQIRGLLCPTCNMAIGLLKDSPINCVNAANYLLGQELVYVRQ